MGTQKNSLEPDQAHCFVDLDLDSNCLQKLSTDNKRCHLQVRKQQLRHHVKFWYFSICFKSIFNSFHGGKFFMIFLLFANFFLQNCSFKKFLLGIPSE